jgi:transcriptional regulator with XRE-family HTH domain
MDDSAELLARNLKRLRQERGGMSQGDLAELAGVELQTIYKYEAKRRWPKAKQLDALAAALKVQPWELLADGSAPAREPTIAEAYAVIGRALGVAAP